MSSTAHSAYVTDNSYRNIIARGYVKKKPTCIIDYNYNMGAVNKIDITS
ncbi:unnamed protein product, partial [Heterotrigona itama]